jgi:hypothetical protein
MDQEILLAYKTFWHHWLSLQQQVPEDHFDNELDNREGREGEEGREEGGR